MEKKEEDLQVGKALLNKIFLLLVISLTAIIAVFIFSQNSPVLATHIKCGGQEMSSNEKCCNGNIIPKTWSCCGSGSGFCSGATYFCYEGDACVSANAFGETGYACRSTTCPSGQKLCGGGCIENTSNCCSEYTEYEGSCSYRARYTYCRGGSLCQTRPTDGSSAQCACPAGTGWNGSSCVSNPCPPSGYPAYTQNCSGRCFLPGTNCNSLTDCGGTYYACSTSNYAINCGPPVTCVYTPAPTIDIKANTSNGPITLANNASATLSWTTTNSPTACTASGAWSGAKSTSGSSQSTGTLSGPQIYTYTLTCTNAGGSGSDSTTINVDAPPRCPPPGRPDQTKYCASQDSCTLPTNDCSSAAQCGGQWQFCPSNSVVDCGPPVTCVTAYCGSGTTRATGLVSAPTFGSGSNFGTTGACIIDPKTAFAPFKIPTYDDLKSLYYSQKSTSTTVTKHDSLTGDRTQSDIPLTGSTAHIYHIGGNLTIANNIPGNESGVIFVDGDLTIAPSSNRLTHAANTGLILVVGGNVAIHKDVTQVDAVIIAKGTICTAYEGGACPTTNIETQQLVINGSLISINQEDAAPIKFRRSLSRTRNIQPAEKINHQVKYLVILRDLLSDTYQKWAEMP